MCGLKIFAGRRMTMGHNWILRHSHPWIKALPMLQPVA